MRIVVCGGRFYDDYATLSKVLDDIHTNGYKHRARMIQPPVTELAHGDCPEGGADILAGYWADANNITCVPFPAEWFLYNHAAGPIRNRVMLRTFKPELVVAFPGGKGTKNCIATAERLGILIEKVS